MSFKLLYIPISHLYCLRFKGENDFNDEPGCWKRWCPKTWHGWLDVVARILFPLAFIAFSVSYWSYYNSKDPQLQLEGDESVVTKLIE